MAYRRYGKRSYKKRVYRKKLSSKRVYKNRSSRAQAGQIVALNKKINRVRKELAPDIQYFDGDLYSIQVQKVNLLDCYKSSINLRTVLGHVNGDYSNNSQVSLGGYWAGLQQGAETVYVKNFKFTLTISKLGSLGYGYNGPLKAEFLIVQATSQVPGTSSVHDQIFGYQPSGLGANNIKYPLNSGFWRRFKILSRKYLSIDNDTINTRSITFNVKPKYHKLPDFPNSLGTDDFRQNDIYVVYRMWGNTLSDDEGITALLQYSFRCYFSHT